MKPAWAETPEDVREHIREAHSRCTNHTDVEGRGEGIHIAIFDSACSLPEHIGRGYVVNQGIERSFIREPDDDTNRHGTAVFRRAAAFAPDAEFSLYQVTGRDGSISIEAYADAIGRAINEGVDIVNLSSGHPWKHPASTNPNVSETKRLLNEQIHVVASAGNYFPHRQQQRPPVHCPSAADGVISVAGLVVYCPRTPGGENITERGGPYFWINEEFSSGLIPDNGVYCGEQGCVGESCKHRRSPEPWPYNPSPSGDNPDVLAPMHIIRRRQDSSGEYLAAGTSFATPFVTASLACLFSELRERGQQLPNPYTLRAAVKETAVPILNAGTPRYDAAALRDSLQS